MFQLLRLKFSITAHCFQVNSLAIRLANVLENSSRFSCWNSNWQLGRDSILSSVPILSNLPHGLVTFKDSADLAGGFVLEFPEVTCPGGASVPAGRCPVLPKPLPWALPQILQSSNTALTLRAAPRGWGNSSQAEFGLCSSSEHVINVCAHPAAAVAVSVSAPAAQNLQVFHPDNSPQL